MITTVEFFESSPIACGGKLHVLIYSNHCLTPRVASTLLNYQNPGRGHPEMGSQQFTADHRPPLLFLLSLPSCLLSTSFASRSRETRRTSSRACPAPTPGKENHPITVKDQYSFVLGSSVVTGTCYAKRVRVTIRLLINRRPSPLLAERDNGIFHRPEVSYRPR